MGINRVKTWVEEELDYDDLNAEFNNVLDNALSLVSPWTGNMAAGGYRLTGLSKGSVASPGLQFTGDTNTGIYSSAADTIELVCGGVALKFTTGTNTFNAANGTASFDVAPGKTVNVDADLTVSGAATISETPPLNANVIKGDGTAGRVIRFSSLVIDDGGLGATIKCTLNNVFNGDSQAQTADIGKGETVSNFTFNAGGNSLSLASTAITGDPLAILSVHVRNRSAFTDFNNTYVYVLGTAIVFDFQTIAGAAMDLTTITNTITVDFLYITSA